MANCYHRDAICVIGDFWTCKVPGCSNAAKPDTGRIIRYNGALPSLAGTVGYRRWGSAESRDSEYTLNVGNLLRLDCPPSAQYRHACRYSGAITITPHSGHWWIVEAIDYSQLETERLDFEYGVWVSLD